MKVDKLNKGDRAKTNKAAVFNGTHVPISFLFEFRADTVLGISRDLLLNRSH